MKKLLAIVLIIFANNLFAKVEYGTTPDQKETLDWIFTKAQRFSGIVSNQPDNWKTMKYFLLSDEELSKQVCPEDPQNCHGLAAVFDTKTRNIFIREDVNPDDSIINLSYLMHEMVHSLQSEYRTEDEMFGTCQKLYNTEKEAYEAQDAFLKSEGQFYRAGNALRFFICH